LSAGVATFSTTTLSVGTHSITAVHSRDPNFTASTSPVLKQKVKQSTDASMIVSTFDPSGLGWSVTTGADDHFSTGTSPSRGHSAGRSTAVSAASSTAPLVDLAIGTLQDDTAESSPLDELAVDLIADRAIGVGSPIRVWSGAALSTLVSSHRAPRRSTTRSKP
jgi:hypothetical protein